MMNGTGFRRRRSWPNEGTALELALRDRVQPRKTSVKIIGIVSKNRTRHLPSTFKNIRRGFHSMSLRDCTIVFVTAV